MFVDSEVLESTYVSAVQCNAVIPAAGSNDAAAYVTAHTYTSTGHAMSYPISSCVLDYRPTGGYGQALATHRPSAKSSMVPHGNPPYVSYLTVAENLTSDDDDGMLD